MKKIIALLLIPLLSSCALYDAYMLTHYDPNEYMLITDIRAAAQLAKSQCDDPVVSKANAIKVANDTQLFVLFSEHVPHNDAVIGASKDLHTIAQGLADQYAKYDKVSSGFCKIKFTSIETNANTMQQTIARRPR